MMLKDRLKKPQQLLPVLEEPPTEEFNDNQIENFEPAELDQTTEIAQAPQSTDDVNPFGGDDEDLSAIDLGSKLIDGSDPDKIAMIANNRSPKAHAVCKAVAKYEEMMGAKDLAMIDNYINNASLIFGISEKGKDNRAAKVLDMLKAQYAHEQEQELMSKDSMFGKRR